MKYFLALPLMIFASNAFSFFISGNELIIDMKEWEKPSGDSTTQAFALSYLSYTTAIAESLEFEGYICHPSPENVTRRQIGAVVAKYLNDHPAEWSEPAYYLVRRALVGAFACGNTSPAE